MKKSAKHVLAIACLLPFAFSAAACSAFPEVADADLENVYNGYVEKYETALSTLADKDFFLNYYVSQISTIEQGGYALSSTATRTGDADVNAGKISRSAISIKTANTEKDGDTEQSTSKNTFLYTLSDGVYKKTVSKTGDETAEEKSFTASETPETFDYTSVFVAFPDFADMTDGSINVFADANGQGMRLEYGYAQEGGAFENLDCTGLETVETFTYVMTVRFDYAGNLLYVEMEQIVRFTAATPQANTPEQGDAEMMSDSGNENTLPPNGKAYQRLYIKTTFKNASTVKVPTAKELETYKA